jgi:hypothetical protein
VKSHSQWRLNGWISCLGVALLFSCEPAYPALENAPTLSELGEDAPSFVAAAPARELVEAAPIDAEGGRSSATQVRHVVRLAGDALGMHIASLLCDEQLGESLPGHELDPSFLPHAQALQRLAAGQLDAVLTTQRLRHRDRRQGLIEHPIGDLVLAAVVPQKHPMWDLRREQLGELLAGDWTHWDQLGGPNNSIETLALPDDDPVWSCAMESLFAGKKLAPHVQRCTNEDVLQIILTRKPMAIGLLPLGTFRSDLDLRVLSINGTQPSPHMVRSGKYPLRVRCALVVRRDAELPVLRFVSYATGNEARASLATLLTPAH